MTTRKDSGHCLCKAITFTVTGEPLYNVVCHCENCRRHGGSIFHCASIFLRSQYELLSGGQVISEYADKQTVSTKPLYRGFCSICGSKIHAKTPLNEDIISVPAGLLDSANTPAPSQTQNQPQATMIEPWKPHKEQFCSHRQEWVPEFGEIGVKFQRGVGGDVVASLGSDINTGEGGGGGVRGKM